MPINNLGLWCVRDSRTLIADLSVRAEKYAAAIFSGSRDHLQAH